MKTTEQATAEAGYAVWGPVPDGVSYPKGVNFHRVLEHRTPDSKPFVIYPPLGDLWIAVDFIFHKYGFLTVGDLDILLKERNAALKPPPFTEEIKSEGAKDAPEMVCWPLKAYNGYFKRQYTRFQDAREKLNLNAHALFVFNESTGHCRERVYNRMLELLLRTFSQKTFGHTDFDFYAVKDSIPGMAETFSFILKEAGRWKEGHSWKDKLHNAKEVWDLLGVAREGLEYYQMAAEFESEVRYSQALTADEEYRGKNTAFYECEKKLEKLKLKLASTTVTMAQKRKLKEKYEEELYEITMTNKKREEPPVIGITGEIFLTEESKSSSADLERELAARGYFTNRFSGLSEYIKRFNPSWKNIAQSYAEHMVNEINPWHRDETKEYAAKGGLTHDAAGHSLKIVALAEKVKELKRKSMRAYDGIIEIFPFGCLPEIVTSNVMDVGGLKYYRFVFDEHAGDAGVMTRLEAYLMMVKGLMKKEAKEAANKPARILKYHKEYGAPIYPERFKAELRAA